MPDLLYPPHVSNPCWWFSVPTALHSRVCIFYLCKDFIWIALLTVVLFFTLLQCDPGVGVDTFFHALYTKSTRMIMLLGTACSEVTESLAKVTPYWNIVQVLTANCKGLFKMIVGVLTTCHTQYTWDSSICIFFNRTTLQVTYLTIALYVHPLWFYKH